MLGRRRRDFCLGLLLSVVCASLSACGSGGGAPPVPALPNGFLVATDAALGTTFVMSIDAEGKPLGVGGTSPPTANLSPWCVAATSTSRLVAIGSSSNNNSSGGSFSVYRIGHDGALTSVGPPVTSDVSSPVTLSMTTAGDRLLLGNGNFSPVMFAVETSTGAVNELGIVAPIGFAPSTISPDGKFAFTVSSYINSYAIDTTTGQGTLISSMLDFFETVPTPPVVHPSGKFVYVPYASATIIGGTPPPGGIAAYAVATDGTLSAVPGMPFGSGINFGSSAGPFTIAAIDPAGAHLFAASSQFIYGFNIDQNSGALTPITGASGFGNGGTLALAFDPSGKYLFASAEIGELWSYSVAANGIPTPVSAKPFKAGNEITSMVSVQP